MVDWLVFNKLSLTRVEAVTLASALLDDGSLRPIGVRSADAVRNAALGEQFLDDSTALYCFVSFLLCPICVYYGSYLILFIKYTLVKIEYNLCSQYTNVNVLGSVLLILLGTKLAHI